MLTFLSIFNHNLDGTLPTELGRLTALETIKLGDGNNLSGTLPTELGLLTQLSFFGVKNNLHTGPLPTELGMLTRFASTGANLYVTPAH